jgi:hypothetical protein
MFAACWMVSYPDFTNMDKQDAQDEGLKGNNPELTHCKFIIVRPNRSPYTPRLLPFWVLKKHPVHSVYPCLVAVCSSCCLKRTANYRLGNRLMF